MLNRFYSPCFSFLPFFVSFMFFFSLSFLPLFPFHSAFRRLSSPFLPCTKRNTLLPLSSVFSQLPSTSTSFQGPFSSTNLSFSTVPPLGDFDSPDYPGMYNLSFKNKREGILPDVPLEDPFEMYNDRVYFLYALFLISFTFFHFL